MKKDQTFNKGIMLVAVLGIVAAFALVCGCTGSSDTTAASGTEQSTDIRTISVTGSTTVLPAAQAAAESYMRENKNADIMVSGGGSSVGVQAVGEGTADIGMASRELKNSEKEKYPNLVQHVIARDGIALIIYKDNPVESLTIDQVKSIYKGEVTNWNEVGGDDMEIVVVGRDSSSGTREYFFESVMNKEDFVATQMEKNSNGAVQQSVAHTPGAIGYVGLGYIDDSIKAVNIDTNGNVVVPTIDNVVKGTYPIARSLNMFTSGEATGLSKDYINFILSSEGQAIVEEEGFVSVK
ncbi:phosphate ABC transporter substrate-binding protein [Methanoplanus limicola]|uniref:Phosphate ABC transporter substrate-binding protein, PhoT family n=1 Tax=Methanoplanus limicola DSM 2279 TaxID=937775 RepID=H1Z2X1_9EURY|nr:phosphate ABC transporter substrate-binding protein [Methanoplanus limicola]EHQ34710.1 phosphate ABC transporter substrate-binding protein, PhoT family [Methanoplanus limicola DSM 2279]